MEKEGLLNFAKGPHISSCQDQALVGHLSIELSFLLCKLLLRKSCSLDFLPTGSREWGF